MRISGGTAKGRRTASKNLFTKTSGGERVRPTSSKVREALFDILRNRIEGARFVDLYAGTGTVGLEALSRGAGYAVLVEPSGRLVSAIRKTVQELGFHDRALVMEEEAVTFLCNAASGNERYNIFFIDPPYQSDEIEKALPLLGEKDLLNENGLVIVEHFFKRNVPDTVGRLKRQKAYRYGDTVLSIYTLEVT